MARRSWQASGPPRMHSPPAPGALAGLAIVRTSWLFGPPGNDFPQKIVAAADRARDAGQTLKVVGDEFGSPTFTEDLADAIVALLASGAIGGIHHLVNSGHASRAGWARELFRQLGRDDAIEEVPASTWPRPSTPPLWAVLEPTPLPDGEPIPPGRRRLRTTCPGCAVSWRWPRSARPERGPGLPSDHRAAPVRPPRRPVRRRRAVRATNVARSASCGGRAQMPDGEVRPGEPLDVGGGRAPRAPLPPAPGRLLDRGSRAGVRRARRRAAAARGDGGSARSSRRASLPPTTGW